MPKGSSFERKVCKQLSLWWTAGIRDDVFWRSSNSGGRATMRRKKGQKTFGHAGDIAATDPIGSPLTGLITFELKRGYSKCSVADALDKLPGRKDTGFEEFVAQAEQAATTAGTKYWALIQRRDSKKEVIFIPRALFRSLTAYQSSGLYDGPAMFCRTLGPGQGRREFVGMPLVDFLDWCSRGMIEAAASAKQG